MTIPNHNTPEIPSLKKSFAIKVLGVGGAGCNAVNHLARESFAGVSFAVMNTDAPALALLDAKIRLVGLTLDDVDVFTSGLALPLTVRLVDTFAPIVRAIAERSPNNHELSLKMENEGGRREEESGGVRVGASQSVLSFSGVLGFGANLEL